MQLLVSISVKASKEWLPLLDLSLQRDGSSRARMQPLLVQCSGVFLMTISMQAVFKADLNLQGLSRCRGPWARS